MNNSMLSNTMSSQDVYQKGFNDGFNAAMKHFNEQQANLSTNKLTNQFNNMNLQQLPTQINHNQYGLPNLQQLPTQLHSNNYGLHQLSNQNNHNQFGNQTLQQLPTQVIPKKLNKNIRNPMNNILIDFNADCSDICLVDNNNHYSVLINKGCDLNKIITIINNNIDCINNKKIIMSLTDDLKNYDFLKEGNGMDHIKNMSKLIVSKVKGKSGFDLFVNICINKNGMNYILVDKFIPKNK